MANSAQAAKRNRQATARRGRNMPLRTRYRGAVKAARRAIAGDDPQAASRAWGEMGAIVDRVAAKGVIHPNKAARLKSRVAKALRVKFGVAPQTAAVGEKGKSVAPQAKAAAPKNQTSDEATRGGERAEAASGGESVKAGEAAAPSGEKAD